MLFLRGSPSSPRVAHSQRAAGALDSSCLRACPRPRAVCTGDGECGPALLGLTLKLERDASPNSDDSTELRAPWGGSRLGAESSGRTGQGGCLWI